MMPVAKKIEPPSWMTEAPARAVMAALNAGSETPQALFVGGCVRNALLACTVKDIDIATRLKPEEATARLENEGIKVVPTGLDHGTVTAVTDEKSYEITTLRRDLETDGRHAVVAYTDDWHEDAMRRDFTMNTLLADETGNIYDPTGQGLADLQAQKVVFVGAPAQRIAEDYLRILRFFRFFAVYGKGEPDSPALQACQAAAGEIKSLSRERITQEFLKILAAQKAPAVLALMFGHDVMADLPQPEYKQDVLARLCRWQQEHDLPDIMARLAVLMKTPAQAEPYLILSNAQKKALEVTRQAEAEIDAADDKTVKKLVYRYGQSRAVQALLLHAAFRDTAPDLSLATAWQPPAFPLSGNDVLAAGVTPGAEIGRVLGAVEKWWLEQEMQPDRAACLTYMKETVL